MYCVSLALIISLLPYHRCIVYICITVYCSPSVSPIYSHTYTNITYLHQNGCRCVAFVLVLTVQAFREWRSVSSFFVQPGSPSRFITLVPLSQSILGSQPCYVPDRIIDLALYIIFFRFRKHVYHVYQTRLL